MRDARQIAIEARMELDNLVPESVVDYRHILELVEGLAIILAGDAETATEPPQTEATKRPDFQAPKKPAPRPPMRGGR